MSVDVEHSASLRKYQSLRKQSLNNIISRSVSRIQTKLIFKMSLNSKRMFVQKLFFQNSSDTVADMLRFLLNFSTAQFSS